MVVDLSLVAAVNTKAKTIKTDQKVTFLTYLQYL